MKDRERISQMHELFLEVNQAREILNEVFFTSTPFLTLGYNASEISVIHRLYDAVKEGGADAADIPNEYYWHHYARFDSYLGSFSFGINREKDTHSYGTISLETQQENHFTHAYMPQLFILNKTDTATPLEMDEITRKILSGGIYRKGTFLRKTLSGVPGLEKVAKRRSYENFWLDDRTKMALAVKLYDPDSFVLLRKIPIKDERFEVWGVKKDADQAVLEKILSESKSAVGKKIMVGL